MAELDPDAPRTDRPAPAPTAAERLLAQVTASWMTQAICVAAQLRLPDALAAGPRASDDLARDAGAHAPSVHRLLRALCTIDVCRQRDDGTFELTETGRLLRSDVPDSLRAWTLWWGAYSWDTWGRLLYSVRTGEGARKTLTGVDGFDHLQRDPEAAAVFNDAMVELSRLSAAGVVRACDFARFRRVVDVGGGHGELLATILRACPATRGVLFDLPHAVDGARRRFAELNLADRCEFVAGDFFESVPAGADAYVLKSVLHDWPDDRARVILATCHRAMAADARLILVERLAPERPEVSPAHQAVARADLHMLVALGAKERSEGEFRELLASSGFALAHVLTAGAGMSVIEAVPA